MPGKNVWRPKGALPDPRWPQAAAGRLDNVRDHLAHAAASSAEGATTSAAVEPSATAVGAAFSRQEKRMEGVQPRGQPTVPREELAALRLGRTAPSNFNLQRHAVMVCGRPVVVPLLSYSLDCALHCFDEHVLQVLFFDLCFCCN